MGVAGIFDFSQKAGQERAPSLPGTGLCRIVYLAGFHYFDFVFCGVGWRVSIAKQFEHRRKSASVGLARFLGKIKIPATPMFFESQKQQKLESRD